MDNRHGTRPSSGNNQREPTVLLAFLFASFSAVAPAAVSLCLAEPSFADPASVRLESNLDSLYTSGETYDAFLASAKARRAAWVKNTEVAAVPLDALATARAIPGRWRLLVSVLDACSDSVNTIPYLAQLVSQLENVEMRIITPAAGKSMMESHRSPDGRAATPTLVVLDEAGNDVGCWIERPAELQRGFLAAKAISKAEENQFINNKQKWYDADAGASTIREVVAVLQAAAAGKPVCGLE